METTLVLSSHNVKKKQTKNKPSDFTMRYNQPIILDPNREYELGLDQLSMSFTWHNINSYLNNQKIKYSSDDGKTWKDLIFPPGVWNYVAFNDFLKQHTKIVTSSSTTYPITLHFNLTTLKTRVNLATNYQLDLTTSNFNDLIVDYDVKPKFRVIITCLFEKLIPSILFIRPLL